MSTEIQPFEGLNELLNISGDDELLVVESLSGTSAEAKRATWSVLSEAIQNLLASTLTNSTFIQANYDSTLGEITFTVLDDSSVQKSEYAVNNANDSTRKKLNIITSPGISASISDNSAGNRTDLTLGVVTSELNVNDFDQSTPLGLTSGGTGGATAEAARTSLGAAKSGANSDIESLSGLTTPLSVAQGGSGANTSDDGLQNLGGLKTIENVGTVGVSIVEDSTNLVSGSYRGELKGIKPGSNKVTVVDAPASKDVAIDVNPDAVLSGATVDADLNTNRLTNAGDPAAPQDLTTRHYVDNNQATKAPVEVASNSAFAGTYDIANLTLSITNSGVLVVDSVNVTSVGTRILFKNQADATQNGIYTLTVAGSSSAGAILTRATDSNSSEGVQAGTFVYVSSGTVNTERQFFQKTADAVLDTSGLVYAGVSDIIVSDVAPLDPINGLPWFDSVNGQLLVYYTNSWVNITGDESPFVRTSSGVIEPLTSTDKLSSEFISYNQGGTGAVPRLVESKLDDVVSILDFIPETEYANIKNGTSTYDTSAAFRAAFTASQGVYVPAGKYFFDGAPITTIKTVSTPQTATDSAFHLYGDGSPNSRIVMASGRTFMELSGPIRACHVHDIAFYNFEHCFKITNGGVNVANRKMWEYCVFEGYTGCAISQQQEDSPYWSVENCTFKADVSSNTSIGVALGNTCNLSTIRDNAFIRNRVHLKLGGGGVDVLVEHNDFLQFSTQGADPRVAIHIYTDAIKGDGAGLNVFSNKFGNENKRADDYYIVYADQESGTFNGDKFPALTTDAAGTKEFRQSQFINNKIQGGGGSTPFIFSTTRHLTDFIISENNLKSATVINYWVEFLNPSTTLTNYSHRWFFGVFGGDDVQQTGLAPQFSNEILNLEVFSADTGTEIWTQKHSPNPVLGANRVGYYMVSNTGAGSFTTGGGASKTTDIVDGTGGINAATFDVGSGLVYPSFSTSNMPGGSNNDGEAGDPLWLHFDLKQSNTDPVTSISVALRKTANGARQWTRIISVPKNWTTFRFPVFIRDSSSTMLLEFKRLFGGSNIDIGRYSLYSSKDCTPQGQVTFDSVKSDALYTGSISVGGTAAANTLDVYEEGTFTPTLVFSTSGSVTYDYQEGFYTLIGNMVRVNLTISTDGISAPTGDVSIGGLPAAISVGTAGFFAQHFGEGKITQSGLGTPNNLLKILASGDSSTNAFRVYKDAAYTTQLQGSDLISGSNKNQIRLSIVYQTD